MQKQKDLHPDKQPIQLQRLSDTRWTARHSAVNAVCCTYDSIWPHLKILVVMFLIIVKQLMQEVLIMKLDHLNFSFH